MKSILNSAKKIVIPSDNEKKKVDVVVKDVKSIVDKFIKKNRILGEFAVGGSIARQSWLPGIHDIDFFLKYDLSLSDINLSDAAEVIVRKCFKNFERLHGSRDYFSVKYKGIDIEIIPVLNIKNSKQARNMTDNSPLHLNWIKKKVKKDKNLSTEIRLAKQFCKAQKVYGAESYISGFSGHSVELLVCYYGSFEKLIRGVSRWGSKVIIDPQRHYKSSKEILDKLNYSRIKGPLIIVDPIQPERNAAAAIDREKLNLFKQSCSKFLKHPSIEFFKESIITASDLKKKKGQSLIILSANGKGKKDIVGAKLRKQFKLISSELKRNKFDFLGSDWSFLDKRAIFWFYFKEGLLSDIEERLGPPKNANKKDIAAFKKKYKNAVLKKGRYYSKVKRKFRDPKKFLCALLKKKRFNNVKFYN